MATSEVSSSVSATKTPSTLTSTLESLSISETCPSNPLSTPRPRSSSPAARPRSISWEQLFALLNAHHDPIDQRPSYGPSGDKGKTDAKTEGTLEQREVSEDTTHLHDSSNTSAPHTLVTISTNTTSSSPSPSTPHHTTHDTHPNFVADHLQPSAPSKATQGQALAPSRLHTLGNSGGRGIIVGGASKTPQPHSISLQRTSIPVRVIPVKQVSLAPSTSSSNSPQPPLTHVHTSSNHRPLLVLDLRPLHSFLQSRFRGSINLALPRLIVKRIQRASLLAPDRYSATESDVAMMALNGSVGSSTASQSLSPTPPLSNSPLLQLSTYITTPAGKRKFQLMLDSMSCSTDVPVDEDAGTASFPSSPSTSSLPTSPAKVSRTSSSCSANSKRISAKTNHPILDTLGRSDIIVVCEDGDRSARSTAAALEASTALCSAIAELQATTPTSARGSVELFSEDFQDLKGKTGAESWLEHGEEAHIPQSLTEGGVGGETQWREPLKDEVNHIPNFHSVSFAGPSATTLRHGNSPGPSSSMSHVTNSHPPKKPARPSLARLDTSERFKTLGTARTPSLRKTGDASSKSPGDGRRTATAVSAPPLTSISTRPPPPPSNSEPATATATATATGSGEISLQNLARLQAQTGPSPASFAEMSLPLNSSTSPGSFGGLTREQADRALARRGSVPDVNANSNATASTGPSNGMTLSLSPSRLAPSSASRYAGLVDDSKPAFDVSVILPNLLFLGPDITSLEEVEELRRRGVKAILNCAVEVSDKGHSQRKKGMASSRSGDQEGIRGNTVFSSSTIATDPQESSEPYASAHLDLGEEFTYLKLPMYDNVEALDVLSHLSTGTAFIHSSLTSVPSAPRPVYVHCRAGKSRSVTVVLAYLIKRFGWSFPEAYEFVKVRRKDVSPNIGFVSLLMEWYDRVKLEGEGEGEGGKEGGR